MTARLTPNRIWQLSYGLSPRALAVIATLFKVRVASVRQLERAHFPDQPRTARRVLAELTERRIVARLRRRVGGVRAGSAGHVYGLDVVGQYLGKQGGPAGGSRLRRPWTPGSRFLDHALGIAEVYVQLVEQERAGAFDLMAFQGEPECWRSFSRMGAPLILKPDAFVRLGYPKEEAWFFIEVDRNTESTRTLAAKAEMYRAYWNSGQEQDRHGVFPRVLWIVPDAARKCELQETLRRIEQGDELFAIATADQLATAVMNGHTDNKTINEKGGDDE